MDRESRDPVWFWFVSNGPHGERFSWDRYTIDLLREFIEEREASSPGFTDSARAVALKAIKLPDVVMIRTAIQILSVIGTDEDLEAIKTTLEGRDGRDQSGRSLLPLRARHSQDLDIFTLRKMRAIPALCARRRSQC
jgi:hypothetical protein